MTNSSNIEEVRANSGILLNTIKNELNKVWAEQNKDKTNIYGEPESKDAKHERMMWVRSHPIFESYCALDESIDNLF